MTHEKSPDDVVLTDAQVREVIERATRDVPRPSGISIAELRQMAGDLYIDPISLERASGSEVDGGISSNDGHALRENGYLPVLTWVNALRPSRA